jgi:hypothetical protein
MTEKENVAKQDLIFKTKNLNPEMNLVKEESI